MKKQHIPELLLVCLLVLMATSVLAAQVKLATFSGGSGLTESPAARAKLMISQGIIGRSTSGSVSHTLAMGFWEMHISTFVSAVGDEPPTARTLLMQNYPNPFNPSTRISFSLAEEAEVRIDLYDVKGRKVDTLLQEVTAAGIHSFTYQPDNLASGAYFILMRADSYRATQRIMLVK